MRIVYLHQYFKLPTDAGGSRSYEMARRLASRGHQVHMVTSDRVSHRKRISGWVETEEAGIHIHWRTVPYTNRMGYMRRLWSFFEFVWKAAPKAVKLEGGQHAVSSGFGIVAVAGR